MRRLISLRFLTYASLILAGLYWQPYRVIRVDGPSMKPTYADGSFKLASSLVGPIKRGDVVVFEHEGELCLKRVALVEGDWYAEIKVGKGWVQDPTAEQLDRAASHGQTVRWHMVSEGQIYVIGDNRANSTDSRMYGEVLISDVLYKLVDQEPNASK